MGKKVIISIIIVLFFGCSAVFIRGDSNDVEIRIDNKQKLDSIQFIKNNPVIPERY